MSEIIGTAFIKWLTSQAASYAITSAFNHMALVVGINHSSGVSSSRELLDEYLGPIREAITAIQSTLDQDRLTKLYSGFTKLRDAPKTSLMRELAGSALADFHEVANLPPNGHTAHRPNRIWRCLAYLGMAYAHYTMRDDITLVARKIADAIQSDRFTSKNILGVEFFGENESLHVNYSNLTIVKESDCSTSPAKPHSIRFCGPGRNDSHRIRKVSCNNHSL